MSYVDGKATLHMKTVEIHDEGEYMLVATNDFGSASTTCELVVTGKSTLNARLSLKLADW